LRRPVEDVVRDVRWGKVSLAGAERDYAVVLSGTADQPVLDADATRALRERRAQAQGADEPFFDRGPGYQRLSGGARSAAVDRLERG
jgi:N-methylhydantoinase B